MCHRALVQAAIVLATTPLSTAIDHSFNTWSDLYGLEREMDPDELLEFEILSRDAWNTCTLDNDSAYTINTYASLELENVQLTWQGLKATLPPVSGSRRRLGGGDHGGSTCQKNIGGCNRCDDNNPPCDSANDPDCGSRRLPAEERRKLLVGFDECLCNFLQNSDNELFKKIHTCRTYLCEGIGCADRIPVANATDVFFREVVETTGVPCCSHNMKDCISWCGTTEETCGTKCPLVRKKPKWLPSGPQTGTCLKRWRRCDNDPTPCCAPATCVWKNPWYSQCLTPEEVPPPEDGCCSHDYRTCIYWCGTTKEQCGSSFACPEPEQKPVWLDEGPKEESDTCLKRWVVCSNNTEPCCSPGKCTVTNEMGFTQCL